MSCFVSPLGRLRVVVLVPCLLVLMTAASGCSYEEGGSVGNYLTDARIQRQSGNLARALELLREALAEYPENEQVRIELAATLLEASPLGLVDLANAAEYVSEEPRRNRPRPEGAVCAVDEDAVTGFDAFDPLAFPSFATIEAAAPSLDSIAVLLTRTADGTGFSTLEGRLREIDVCSLVDPDTGVLQPYDRAGILADLRADGLTNLQIGNLLITYAVSQLVDSYYDLFTERIPSLGEAVTLHRVRQDGVTYISFCATSAPALLGVYAVTVEPAEALLRAILAVELRAFLLGYPAATDALLADADRALIAIQQELADCSG